MPRVASRYPLWDEPELRDEVDAAQWYLPDAEEHRRETLLTSAIDAVPTHCQRLPGPSFLPLAAAAAIGASFILATFHLWWASSVSTALGIAIVLVWLWTGTARPPEKDEKHVGRGLVLPLYASGAAAPGWWGMCIAMVADASAFAALVFAYFYYWTVDAGFLARATLGDPAWWAAGASLVLVAAWVAVHQATERNHHGRSAQARALLVAGGVAGLVVITCLLGLPRALGLDPRAHVYDAMVWLTVGWTALHVALGVLMNLYSLARSAAGLLTARHDADLRNTQLYWHFTFVQGVAAMLMLVLVPGLP